MWRIRNEIQVISIFVGILSTPSADEACTLGTPTGTHFGMVVGPVGHIIPPLLK